MFYCLILLFCGNMYFTGIFDTNNTLTEGGKIMKPGNPGSSCDCLCGFIFCRKKGTEKAGGAAGNASGKQADSVHVNH